MHTMNSDESTASVSDATTASRTGMPVRLAVVLVAVWALAGVCVLVVVVAALRGLYPLFYDATLIAATAAWQASVLLVDGGLTEDQMTDLGAAYLVPVFLCAVASLGACVLRLPSAGELAWATIALIVAVVAAMLPCVVKMEDDLLDKERRAPRVYHARDIFRQ